MAPYRLGLQMSATVSWGKNYPSADLVQAHAPWRSPDLKPKIEANQSSVVEGVDGAISAWVADERNRIWGNACGFGARR